MIRSNDDGTSPEFGDPLIDEVRAIRREICAEYGNDVDRLVDHLRQVEAEYRSGSGRFAGLLKLTSAQVVAGWGDEVNDLTDPVVEDARRPGKL